MRWPVVSPPAPAPSPNCSPAAQRVARVRDRARHGYRRRAHDAPLGARLHSVAFRHTPSTDPFAPATPCPHKALPACVTSAIAIIVIITIAITGLGYVAALGPSRGHVRCRARTPLSRRAARCRCSWAGRHTSPRAVAPRPRVRRAADTHVGRRRRAAQSPPRGRMGKHTMAAQRVPDRPPVAPGGRRPRLLSDCCR